MPQPVLTCGMQAHQVAFRPLLDIPTVIMLAVWAVLCLEKVPEVRPISRQLLPVDLDVLPGLKGTYYGITSPVTAHFCQRRAPPSPLHSAQMALHLLRHSECSKLPPR